VHRRHAALHREEELISRFLFARQAKGKRKLVQFAMLPKLVWEKVTTVMTLRDEVHKRSGGRCECVGRRCGHSGRCMSVLRGNWEFHRIETSEPLTLSNIVALCEACGRHARGSPVGPLPGF
jgi:hypothetical protein